MVFALELKLSKTLRRLVYFVLQLWGGGFAPAIGTVQNTQAHSEFLTTSIPKQKPRLHKNYLSPLVNYPLCLTFRNNVYKDYVIWPRVCQLQFLAKLTFHDKGLVDVKRFTVFWQLCSYTNCLKLLISQITKSLDPNLTLSLNHC